MRARAKENLSHVLLTLLSIIQALALELLWSHVQEADYLFDARAETAVYWLQVTTSICGVFVVWVVYATNVMRFRWVPGIGDSVYPFIVGLLQFMLIENLGPGSVGVWLLLLALMFAVMHWVSHVTMRRARADADNEEFFSRVAPASRRDFYPAAALVALLATGGGLVLAYPESLVLAFLTVFGAFVMLAVQMNGVRYFWNRSMFSEVEPQA
jgi:hypothetical protein